MKIPASIARILLGLIFFVFGLNQFLNLIPAGTLPSALAGQFWTVPLQWHYGLFVSGFELAGGALLQVNRGDRSRDSLESCRVSSTSVSLWVIRRVDFLGNQVGCAM